MRVSPAYMASWWSGGGVGVCYDGWHQSNQGSLSDEAAVSGYTLPHSSHYAYHTIASR